MFTCIDTSEPAFWFAEIAYRIGGMFGVYLLSQLCIVLTYWAIEAAGWLREEF